MMFRQAFCFLVLFLGISLLTYSQNRNLAKLNRQLKTVQKYQQNEKVFLHLSQPSATPGDVIWYSGYVVDVATKKLSEKSSRLFTKIVNNRGAVVAQSISQINNGKTHGSIIIPDTLSDGTFKIVSYSSWMKNFTQANSFSQSFKVRKPEPQNIQLTLVYSDSVYQANERVKATLLAFDGEGNPQKNISISYRIRSVPNDSILFKRKLTRTGNNKFDISFGLPKTISSKFTGALEVAVKHNDKTIRKKWAIPTQVPQVDIRFFPEGGNYIAGLENRMAFKATGINGNPVSVKAVLIQNGNTILDTVQTIHNGMGSFHLTPESSNNYALKILSPYSSVTTFPLPDPAQDGTVLSVTRKNKNILAIKAASKESSAKKSAYISLDMGGKMLWGESIELDSTYTRNLSSKQLPMGIARITLFNEKLMPQAERLVFLNPEKQMEISLSTSKKQYQKREKVTLNINTNNKEGDPLSAHLSLSVYDANQMIEGAEAANIVSSLLLDSELRGHITDPNYYLTNLNQQKRTALDHLMMIHGWRKISWEEIGTKKISEYRALSDVTGISGTVTQDGQPVSNADVKLLRLGKNVMFKRTTTDKHGQFNFKSVKPVAENFNKIRLSAQTAGGSKDVNITLDKEYLNDKANREIKAEYFNFAKPNFASHVIEEKSESDTTTNYRIQDPDVSYTNIDRTLALDEIVVSGQRLSPEAKEWLEEKRNTNTFGYSISGKQLRQANISTLSGFPRSGRRPVQGIISMIREAAPVYSVQNGKILLKPPTSINNESGALFVVNGSRAGYNLRNVAYLSVDNIKEINVYSGAGSGKYAFAPSGVIEIKTRTGSETDISKKIKKLEANEAIFGSVYTPKREYYTPNYSKNTEKEKKSKDYRASIHWDPHIVTNKQGKKTISFYLTDAETKARIIVNGITDKGTVGASKKTISIK